MEKKQRNRLGPGGFCICPKCGWKKGHYPDLPCIEEKCPHCGTALLREGGEHYRVITAKRKNKK